MSWGVSDDTMFEPSAGVGTSLGAAFQTSSGTGGSGGLTDFPYQPQQQPATGRLRADSGSSNVSTSRAGGVTAATSADEATVLHHNSVELQRYDPIKKGYELVGTVGAAIIGSQRAGKFRVVLYLPNQSRVCDARVDADMACVVQASLYLNLVDGSKQNWSLKFASTTDRDAWVRYLAIAKAALAPREIVSHTLVAGKRDGGECHNGEIATCAYTGYVLNSDGHIGAIFATKGHDSKFKMQLGSAAVPKGLTEGMIGMFRGSKRIIVVPADLAYGAAGSTNIPPNANLLYEVSLVKSKPAAEDEADDAGAGASGNRVMDHMRAMGQGVMAGPGPAAGALAPMPGYGGMIMQAPQPMLGAGVAPMPGTSAYQVSSDPTIMQLLLDNQKNQNELRMQLGTMTSKLDEVSLKVDRVDPFGGMGEQHKLSGMVLLHNLQRIIAENDLLKRENYDKTHRIDILNDKVQKLLAKNEAYIDSSSRIIETRNDAIRVSSEETRRQLQDLHTEKAKADHALAEAQAELAEATRQAAKLKLERSQLRTELDAAIAELTKVKEACLKMRSQAKDDEAQIQLVTQAFKDAKSELKVTARKLEGVQEELAEEKQFRAKAESELAERKRKFASEVKRIEATFEDEKKRFELESDSLRETLRQERLASGVVTQETVTRIEKEQEEKWRALMRQQEVSVTNAVLAKAQKDRAAAEAAAAERARAELAKAVEQAHARGRAEGAASAHAQAASAPASAPAPAPVLSSASTPASTHAPAPAPAPAPDSEPLVAVGQDDSATHAPVPVPAPTEPASVSAPRASTARAASPEPMFDPLSEAAAEQEAAAEAAAKRIDEFDDGDNGTTRSTTAPAPAPAPEPVPVPVPVPEPAQAQEESSSVSDAGDDVFGEDGAPPPPPPALAAEPEPAPAREPEPEPEPVRKPAAKPAAKDLFGDDDDPFSAPAPAKKATPAKASSARADPLFGDDDPLSAPAAKPAAAKASPAAGAKPKPALFGDEEDDMSWLAGSKPKPASGGIDNWLS